jgi:hypothetical protein
MLPTKPPGPKTGLVSPNCYAASLLDCDGEKATREHYISSTLLKRFGALHVDGLSWAEGTQQLTARTLTAEVLCGRHNNALSALDTFIGEFDDVLTAGLQGDAGAHAFDGED